MYVLIIVSRATKLITSLPTADVLFSQKLAEELKYEKEGAVAETEPEFLKTFKEQGLWTVSILYDRHGFVLNFVFIDPGRRG
jgi:hypothetical protein